MIRCWIEKCRKEGLSSWSYAFFARAVCYKNVVDTRQRFAIVHFENPTILRWVVHIKHSETAGVFFCYSPLSPRLENGATFQSFLLVQVECVENERFAFGVEDSAEGPLKFSPAADVEYINNMQTPCAQNVANVVVRRKQLLLALHGLNMRKRFLRKLLIPRDQPSDFVLRFPYVSRQT